MKKTLIKIFACFAVLCITVVGTYAASTSSTCYLNKGTYSVETSSVGVSTKATGSATNYSDSTNGINMTIMSAWTGWPYTVEYSTAVHPGDSYSKDVTQDRNSVFYLELENFSMYTGAHAKGRISVD